jgi:prevent-host-death family protein
VLIYGEFRRLTGERRSLVDALSMPGLSGVDFDLPRAEIAFVRFDQRRRRNSVMKKLSLKDAKKMLPALVDRAVAGEPTVIIRDGGKEAVLVSSDEWERVSKAPSFADLLLAFPSEPADIPERSRRPARALRDTGC